MSRAEHSESRYREAINSAKLFSEKIERLVKAEDWDETWGEIETLIAERNQALEIAFVPSLPEALHQDARSAFALAKQQDKNLMNEAKQRQQSAGAELVKLNKSKKSIQSYLSGDKP